MSLTTRNTSAASTSSKDHDGPRNAQNVHIFDTSDDRCAHDKISVPTNWPKAFEEKMLTQMNCFKL